MQEYTYFFLFLLQNIGCGYSLEPPRWGGYNVHPQKKNNNYNKKNSDKTFNFYRWKISVYCMGKFS